MDNKIIAGCIATSLFLSACGGSDSENSDTTTLSGRFVDSAVANINYKTETLSGVTDSDGKFEYIEGEVVTFSIGGITFPAVTAIGTVTPLTLAGVSSTDNDAVINIARLLQSLDSDGDSSNGITISDDVKNAAKGNIDFNVTVAEFETNAEVLSIVATTTMGNLVTKEAAVSHLNSTLEDEGIVSNASVSTWAAVEKDNGELTNILVFSLLNDGTYFAGQVEEPDNGEQCYGFEFVKYSVQDVNISYDYMLAAEKAAIEDDDITVFDIIGGDIGYQDSTICGLSDSISAEDFQNGVAQNTDQIFNNAYYVDSSTLYLFANERTDENIGEVEQYNPILTKQVATSSNPLIGTWLSSSHTKLSNSNTTLENELLAFVFTDSGYYIQMEAKSDDANKGIEVGKYDWDSDGNTLTPSIISDNGTYSFDYNGDIGLSDFAGQALAVTITANRMEITVPESDGDITATFIRQ